MSVNESKSKKHTKIRIAIILFALVISGLFLWIISLRSDQSELAKGLEERDEYSQSWMGRYRQIDLLPSCVKNFGQGECDGPANGLISSYIVPYEFNYNMELFCSSEQMQHYENWRTKTERIIEENNYHAYIAKIPLNIAECRFVGGDDSYMAVWWEGKIIGTVDSGVYDAEKGTSPHLSAKLYDVTGLYSLDTPNFPNANVWEAYRELPNLVQRILRDYENAGHEGPHYPPDFLEGLVLGPEAIKYYKEEERLLK